MCGALRHLGQLRTFLWICLLLLFPAFLSLSQASADILYLEGGGVLEGDVSLDSKGDYSVVLEPGQSMSVKSSKVVRRETKESPHAEFMRRMKSIGARDRSGLLELAAFAESKRMRRTALKAYNRILQIDPHHPAARERLGYVLYKNRWHLKKDLKAKGFVSFRGLLMRPEDVQRMKRKEAEKELELLLLDAASENQFLRENALVKLRELSNPLLLQKLQALVKSKSELEQVVAIRILKNLPAKTSAPELYAAFMRVSREDSERASLEILKSTGFADIGRWAKRDLDQLWTQRTSLKAFSGKDLQRLRKLFLLAEHCPHRHCIDALMPWLSDKSHGAAVSSMLAKIFNSAMPRQGWRSFWRRSRSSFSEDLGWSWIRRR